MGREYRLRCDSWRLIEGNRFARCKRLEGHPGACSDGYYQWRDGKWYGF